jgi:ribokinase
MPNIKVVVPGGLNTDLVAAGLPRLAEPGKLITGKELKISPGGKSRNVAEMIAVLSGPGVVAMVGRTAKDPYGLWKVPMSALETAGVDTAYVQVGEFRGKLPGVALIPVDQKGNNQIYLLPGANADFSDEDIRVARPAFEAAQKNSGLVVLSMELPLATALAALDISAELGLKVVLDPGGIQEGEDYRSILDKNIFLLKPNEHEAEILSGVVVSDMDSAKKAADILRRGKIQNVLITAGAEGAYLFMDSVEEHIPVPKVDAAASGEKDATGSGDQAMAAICAMLVQGRDLAAAARLGVAAGTLQFYRAGIVPVTREELEPYL